MLPCFCACGRTVYSRYKPLYLLMMLNLADSHQDAEAQLMNGNLFTIQKSSTNPFGRVPADQETEMGVNRDSKSPGGIADISMNPMQRHSHGNSCQLRGRRLCGEFPFSTEIGKTSATPLTMLANQESKKMKRRYKSS